jgi:hypothetical protein
VSPLTLIAVAFLVAITLGFGITFGAPLFAVVIAGGGVVVLGAFMLARRRGDPVGFDRQRGVRPDASIDFDERDQETLGSAPDPAARRRRRARAAPIARDEEE